MNEEIICYCPYCGEKFIIEPEPFDQRVEYIEDCHVCCRPIVVEVIYDIEGSQVRVEREN